MLVDNKYLPTKKYWNSKIHSGWAWFQQYLASHKSHKTVLNYVLCTYTKCIIQSKWCSLYSTSLHCFNFTKSIPLRMCRFLDSQSYKNALAMGQYTIQILLGCLLVDREVSKIQEITWILNVSFHIQNTTNISCKRIRVSVILIFIRHRHLATLSYSRFPIHYLQTHESWIVNWNVKEWRKASRHLEYYWMLNAACSACTVCSVTVISVSPYQYNTCITPKLTDTHATIWHIH